MIDLTTMHLKCLLEKATPGPWEYVAGDGPDERYIGDPDIWGMCIGVEANGEGSSCSDADLTLAAAAPQLAREVIRLRGHIEELITVMEVKATAGVPQDPATIANCLKEKVLGDHDE